MPVLLPPQRQYDEQLRDIAASLTRPRCRRALPPLERPTRLPPDRLPVSICSQAISRGFDRVVKIHRKVIQVA